MDLWQGRCRIYSALTPRGFRSLGRVKRNPTCVASKTILVVIKYVGFRKTQPDLREFKALSSPHIYTVLLLHL